MGARPTVSIIVPVFNTRLCYLDECFDSIRRQKYDNLEVVVVDDGSDTKVRDAIDAYDFGGVTARVFHRRNSGVSASRNFGIEKAQGDLIMFLDSDDTLCSDNVVEMMVSEYLKRGCTIKFQYYVQYKNKSRYCPCERHGLYSGKGMKLISDDFITNKMPCFSYNFLFLRKDIENSHARFNPKQAFMEELSFVLPILKNTESIYFSGEPTMSYRQVGSSCSNSFNIQRRIDSIIERYETYKTVVSKKRMDDFRNSIIALYIKSAFHIAGLKERKMRRSYNRRVLEEIRKVNPRYRGGALDVFVLICAKANWATPLRFVKLMRNTIKGGLYA